MPLALRASSCRRCGCGKWCSTYLKRRPAARVILGMCKVGGVRRDIDAETLKGILDRLTALEKRTWTNSPASLSNDYSIKHRLVGVGHISKEDAYTLGCVGPMVRASGLAMTCETLGYAAYKHLDVEPMVETAGDCYARCLVRIREIFHSIDLIRQAAGKIPDGPIDRQGEGHARRGVLFPHRAAPGRSDSLCQGKRLKIPAAVPGASTHLQQYPGNDQSTERLGGCGCAEHHSNPRSLHQLHRKVTR